MIVRKVIFKRAYFKKFIWVFISFILLTGCQSASYSPEQTLYQQLGGQSTVKSLIKVLVLRLHRDDRLSELFNDVDDKELSQNLQDFICHISDGGCEYQGAEMLDIHTEMFITKAEFDHFVSLFIFSMQDEAIPFLAQNKLLSLLADLRGEVIEI